MNPSDIPMSIKKSLPICKREDCWFRSVIKKEKEIDFLKVLQQPPVTVIVMLNRDNF